MVSLVRGFVLLSPLCGAVRKPPGIDVHATVYTMTATAPVVNFSVLLWTFEKSNRPRGL